MASRSVFHRGPKGHYLVVNFLFGIAFLSSSFSILTVTEENTKSKHIQFISGVSAAAFWLSALLWDLLSFLVPTLLLVVSTGWCWAHASGPGAPLKVRYTEPEPAGKLNLESVLTRKADTKALSPPTVVKFI